jgi:hypothetical protein
MKKLQLFRFLITITTILFSFSLTTAQKNENLCTERLYRAFKNNSENEPKVLHALGASPQFGKIQIHSAGGAYNHLNDAYRQNLRENRAEIDLLLRSLGYSGFKDVSFGPERIEAVVVPTGTIGWMGAYNSGHKYAWSKTGNPFNAYKINAKDGTCFVYIMQTCGNIFAVPGETHLTLKNKKPCEDGIATPDCPICTSSIVDISASSKINSGNFVQASQPLTLTGSYKGNSLELGSLPLLLKLAYEYSVSAKATATQKIRLQDIGNGVPATQSVSLPLNLNFKPTLETISAGTDGRLNIDLTKKQYKKIKKVYPTSVAATSSAPSQTLFTKKESMEGYEASTVSTTKPSDGGGQVISFVGASTVEDGIVKQEIVPVLVIGSYRKDGKLAKGETADKYLCLGTYNLDAVSSLGFTVKGETKVDTPFQTCADSETIGGITMPVDMRYSITKQQVTVGDFNRVYVSLTKEQYKKMGKLFSRCCSDGSTSCFK